MLPAQLYALPSRLSKAGSGLVGLQHGNLVMSDWPLEGTFDDAFARRMCAVAAATYGREMGSRGLDVYMHRINQLIQRLGSGMLQVHLYDGELWRQGRRGPLASPASKLIRLFYYYRTARTLVVVVVQYMHDLNMMSLYQLGSIDRHTKASQVAALADYQMETDDSQQARLLRSFAWARHWLERLGSPYRDYTTMIQLIYLTQIWLASLTYLQPYLIHVYVHPIDYVTIRMLTDSERERANYTRMSCQVLNILVRSSRTQARIGRSACLSLGRAKREHCQRLRLLRRLALEGRFEPPNRSGHFMAIVSRSCFGVSTTYLTLALLLLCTFVSPKAWIAGYTSWPDQWDWCEFWLLCVMIVLSVSFYLANCTALIMDRLKVLYSLEQIVRTCLQTGLSQVRRSRSRAQRNLFDEQLALVVVHFKISVKHYELLRRPMSDMVLLMTQAMVFGPIISIVHAPLLDYFTQPLVFACYFFIFLVVDLGLVPVCHMHSLSCRLYRLMARLVALVAQLESVGTRKQLRACDQHLARLLRCELADADFFVQRLSVKLAGYVYNYQRFLRLHFWGGLILCGTSVVANRLGSAQPRSRSLFDRIGLVL